MPTYPPTFPQIQTSKRKRTQKRLPGPYQEKDAHPVPGSTSVHERKGELERSRQERERREHAHCVSPPPHPTPERREPSQAPSPHTALPAELSTQVPGSMGQQSGQEMGTAPTYNLFDLERTLVGTPPPDAKGCYQHYLTASSTEDKSGLLHRGRSQL